MQARPTQSAREDTVWHPTIPNTLDGVRTRNLRIERPATCHLSTRADGNARMSNARMPKKCRMSQCINGAGGDRKRIRLWSFAHLVIPSTFVIRAFLNGPPRNRTESVLRRVVYSHPRLPGQRPHLYSPHQRNGRRRARSPSLAAPTGFKPAADPTSTSPAQQRSAEVTIPRRLRAPAVFETVSVPDGFTLPKRMAVGTIHRPQQPHPASNRGRLHQPIHHPLQHKR